MKKILCYVYLGENGSVLTPVKIEGVPCVEKYRLVADEGYQLTRDNVNFVSTITVSKNEVSKWHEVLKGQG